MSNSVEKRKYRDRFIILKTQENDNEINWSSSDNEADTSTKQRDFCKLSNKNKVSKRKRYKSMKNKCNLQVTITDNGKPNQNNNATSKSPILHSKIKNKGKTFDIDSPISLSPILPTKRGENIDFSDISQTSPILMNKSSVNSSKTILEAANLEVTSPILSAKSSLNLRENITKCVKILQYEDAEKNIIPATKVEIESEDIFKENLDNNFEFDILTLNDHKEAVVGNVNSFFNSKSAEGNSPLINESVSEKTSESSVDIASLTQTIQKSSNETLIPEQTIPVIKKEKIKYKKGGLISRLDLLLKKQQANISVWQHERYLAENSNFVIPKKEFRMFRIQKFSVEYGCHVLDVTDLHTDVNYIVIINNIYANNTISVEDSLLKLYEPYNIIDLHNKYKFIVNVCKYICSTL